ncbi:50S ribosomal protein L3 N(5)-glutamine methyltransferase [Tepidimonas taiwanensis]|uniref:50S ribosomal protein L3 glutamine methyltransferase n=1 Tax=Tepidimonas taiwanensis TaxID=307486 RepID=A0A554X971_9BURK|nr:50S ribosomal protein L3 N(5)-glutamine methyltransferase [Tepidimonas taiwanensis]MDM7462659.1 50S ribosomal protein L3 N(5)-glutamine methyltransferase [Tepidimonas taiwanensis]TSE32380.1 50S ribosomal protein L3 glutamine methyltransferase [Tepidimonas taiwanensis]UBQ06560.1 50S ribosomal protein L3 N(5)-glutamine methyltransferase [Tepidimonas taiwanensis]
MIGSNSLTLGALLRAAEERLQQAGVAFGHGTTNARDEAAWLLLWRLGLPLDWDLDAHADDPVNAEQAQAVQALIEERIRTRKPAAYLTGEAWLQGVPFHVNERVIVPRSLIAELIAAAPQADELDPWLSADTCRVLDLCTGNGSLAVLAAMAWPEVTVDASDISPDALAVAQRNVERHGLQDRIRLIRSDGWSAITGRYDLILCNPPYVNRTSMAQLPPEFRAEPALALDGGEDGMDFVRHLLAHALDHMTPDAVLVLEIGHERPHFERAFPTLPVVWLRTSGGDDAVLLITRDALAAAQADLPPDPRSNSR